MLLLLIVAANAFAARLDVQPRMLDTAVESPRKAQVLRTARAAFVLSDGSEWITHPAPAQREPNAVAVSRFAPDGSVRVFLVSDWLPKGSIPRGWCGQVYGVTLLTDGRVAVSAGWTDGRESHNGIFILRALEDGSYTSDKLIELPGVSDISGGPRNTILAVTDNPSLPGGGPLLTLLNAEGRLIGHLFDEDRPMSASEASQNAMKARLQRLGEHGFALYDPAADLVRVFDVVVRGTEATVTPLRQIFIGDDVTVAHAPVLGIHGDGNGDIVVVRVGRIGGTPGTQLTIYGRDGAVKEAVTLQRPWQLMLRETGRVRGVLLKDRVVLDTIGIRAE
jgi:hypothetical protein